MVAAIVWDDCGTEDEIIGALLHDTVEDGGGQPMLDTIRRDFGNVVASIVKGCSDSIPGADGEKGEWRKRKEDYIAAVPHKDASTLHVSMADKLANARDILADFRRDGEKIWTRFKGGREGTLWYYSALVDAFRKAQNGCGSRLLDELEATVTELKRLAQPS